MDISVCRCYFKWVNNRLGCGSVGECFLASVCKALGSVPCTSKSTEMNQQETETGRQDKDSHRNVHALE